ncbi:hypothetical protein GCT13_28300 [Paraburkholderia sp. CNPSo 3157]|uniref:Uncharacterized protein n=1 Tax=Paraburkholderia franconis TaxID=2654983 RepID=A0A7X1NF12_9BURK|nr:hypothetical protein [Paraburkholderia franconis]MPW20674.1 hypothetical protein [Paraburkholderia franconis]
MNQRHAMRCLERQRLAGPYAAQVVELRSWRLPAACDFITVISIPFLMRFDASGQKLLNPGFHREHTVRFHGNTIALSLSIVYVLSKKAPSVPWEQVLRDSEGKDESNCRA